MFQLNPTRRMHLGSSITYSYNSQLPDEFPKIQSIGIGKIHIDFL